MRSVQIICVTLLVVSWDISSVMGQASPELSARMRPLGSPSAVDRYLPNRYLPASPKHGQTSVANSVRQVAWMQSSDSSPMTMPSLPPSATGSGSPLPGFSFPNSPSPASPGFANGSGLTVPPSGSLPAAPPSTVVTPIGPSATNPLPTIPPSSNIPRSTTMTTQPGAALPMNPNVNSSPLPSAPLSSAPLSSAPLSSAPSTAAPGTRIVPNGALANPVVPRTGATNDYAPIAQPRLEGFATVDNCRNVTGPSSYRAAGFFNCDPRASGGPTYTVPASYTPPPAQIAPVSTLPPAAAYPGAPVSITGTLPPVLPGSAGYRPLFSFGQENNPVQVGQGLIGQPVAYVPGQTFRNVLRYLAP